MNATQSSRACTSARTRLGPASRRSSRRPPPAVTVRSIVASSDPARRPSSAWVSSRLRRVAASICIADPWASRTGGRRSGSRPRCVISSHSTMAPIAAVSGRVNAP